MKKYIAPEAELILIEDVISCSFGMLEELPPSGHTPNMNLDENMWDWDNGN